MPTWLDETGEWAALVTVVGLVFGALLWLIRTEIMRTRNEFRPNGGDSLRDQVDLILNRQSDVITDMSYLRRRLDEHVDHHYRTENRP
jgi:hypothetical protein